MKQQSLLVLALVALLGAGQTVLAQPEGLIGHWPFDGDTLDYSGNDFHGTMVGTETYVPGMVGQALDLDGSSYVDCGNHDAYNVGENLTMAVWFNVPGFTKTWETILAKGDNSYRFGTNNSGASHFGMNGPSGGWWNGSTIIDDGEWHHVACTYDGATAFIYVDGAVDGEQAKTGAFGGDGVHPFYIGENAQATNRMLGGTVDDVMLFNRALPLAEVQKIMLGLGDPTQASSPSPADEALDVPRDLVLEWGAGDFAVKHDVYLGTSFDDVNDATAGGDLMIGQGLTDTALDVGRLEFGQTYFWRVDEVNGAPDNTVFKGVIWSLTIEPHGRPITGITATASSSFAANQGPENTVNGSGLNELDQHSTTATDMWLSGLGDPTPSIQYEFDKAYKLDQLLVWNSNQLIESFIGLGAKDVVIETSLDGAEWTVLEGATLFNQATGTDTYTANTTIEFGGILAQYVRITITAGYGMLPQYSLSEVRFLYIPTFARIPEPADGSAVDSANVALAWRAGREAASHQVNLGTDPADLALVATTSDASYAANGLNYSTTYYWSITEVNDNEAVTSHTSDVWSFTTPDYGTVDDFDQYDDACNRIFFAWADGLGHSGGDEIDDCEVPASNGNGGGSIVGHDQPPFAEKTIVNLVGSSQSLPLEYDNAFGQSEAALALDGEDWSASGIQTLAIAFRGTAGNTGTLYVKINNTKILYDRNPADIAGAAWLAWNIDLTGVSGLQNVTSLTIGVYGANAAGMLYIDDIRLYPLAGELLTPADPGNEGLVAKYSFDGNANDSSGNGRNGAEISATYGPGMNGQAIVLDGFGGAVDLGRDDAFDPAGSFSVSLWANAASWNISSWGHVMMGNRGENGVGWQVRRFGGNPTVSFTTRGIGQDDNPESNAPMPLGEWVNITAVYDNDNNTKALYFNGGSVGQANTNPGTVAATTHNTYIGARATSDNAGQEGFFEGSIDDVYFYNRALSMEEVLFLAGLTEAIHKPF